MAVETVDKLFMGLGVAAIAVAGYLIVAQNMGSGDAPADNSAKVAKVEPEVAKDPVRKTLPPRPAGVPLEAPKGATPVERLFNHFDILDATPEHTEPFIEVQHILIGFKKADGSETVNGKNITRTEQQAKELAAELYDRALKGEDFNAMVTTYTNDSPPGIYGMVNNGADSAGHPGAYQRGGMVPAFGNVGWRLNVGEIGVSNFDAVKSPYGYHIVKRTK